MSINTAAVVDNRGALSRKGLVVGMLLVCIFLQGLGGALTTGIPPVVSATLILIGGTAVLLAVFGLQYRSAIFTMKPPGGAGKTRILGFDVDTVVLRWAFVVLTGITSVGINLGIAHADGTIGTGPRLAIQACGTLLAGFTTFVARREGTQLVMRGLLLGAVLFSVGVFNGGGKLGTAGIVWAAVCGLHMFTMTKALTVFGTRKNRDCGMLWANVLALLAILVVASFNDGMPSPDKFEGALLPVGVLYVAIPLSIMVIPILGMNWTRNHLEESDQAMWTSTAPIWGAIAALGLATFGWAVPPKLDAGQWTGIVMVVLAAVGAAIEVTSRAKWKAERAELLAAQGKAYGDLRQVGYAPPSTDGDPQTGPGTAGAEGEPSADLGEPAGADSLGGVFTALDGLSFGQATNVTIRVGDVLVTARQVEDLYVCLNPSPFGDALSSDVRTAE